MSSEMSSDSTPYIPREPGDLVSASDWNSVQVEIKKDIAGKIKQAVENIPSVPHSDDSDKLENKSAKELSEEIVNAALQQIAKRTGHLVLFKRLEAGTTNLVEHNLHTFPLVDIYVLDPFDIVYTEENDERADGQGYFFLYNADHEQRLRSTGGTSFEIEQSSEGDKQFKIRWSELLSLYHVEYNDRSSLSNLEGEFWNTLFSKPNDHFDDDDYFHSPWFSRCCGEGRTIAQLKSKGEWDDIYLKMITRKTVNTIASPPELAPNNIEVVHYNFDRLGLTYQGGGGGGIGNEERRLGRAKGAAGDEARVMVLLQV